jgi:serine/threonine protein kinase
LNERAARTFFQQIVSAVDHCHAAGVAHRDLKMDNMLLNAQNQILLTDFGLGRSLLASNISEV